MSVYITRINGLSYENPMQYMQYMVAELAHLLGIKELGIYRYNGDSEKEESLHARMDGIIAGINRKDLIICQFPTGNGLRFERTLLSHLKAYGGRIAIFLQDLEPLHYEERRSLMWETVNLYNQAEVMIVPSLAMRQFLLDNRIRKDMKFVIQEMWDDTAGASFFRTAPRKKEFVFLNDETNDTASDEAKNGFGLVWYRNDYEQNYMKYGIPFSLGRFLAAGIPVIVPEGIACQSIIEENHLGIIVNSLDEASAKIDIMEEEQFQEYVRCADWFSSSLRNGYYTKNCLVEAMQAFYRKDAGVLSIPMRVYELENPAFSFTVLRESYGGNLALSWSYQGYTDGFLIYDTSGRLVYKSDCKHQHYYLIKGYGKDSGFIVKAYVETLRGRMIVAESELTCLRTERDVSPGVSLIIPAYNAGDFIARSVDTALAQTLAEVEIIIVNDGSSDETSSIIDWYAEKYANVLAVHQENAGPAVARNSGIMKAKGQYIGFIDSDDMIHPDRMASLYRSARKNNCDVAVTSAYQITNDGYEIWIQYQMEEDIAVPVENFLRRNYIPSCGFGLVVWNKLYRASLVKSHLFPAFVGEEDVAWTPYILSYADQICYLNDCSYEWDRSIRNSTLGTELGKKTKEERFRCYQEVIMFYLNNGNIERRGLLKEVAMTHLANLSVWYTYPEYEKLRRQIEKTF